MESDTWSRVAAAAASKRHQSSAAHQPRYDPYLGFDEIDGGDDDARAEFSCPFCAEDFDLIELCCHIDDEHPIEARNGVCPVCATRVGMDMAGHITMQHGSLFKMQRRRRFRKGSSGSHSTLSFLRKEFRDGNLQYLIGGSPYLSSSSTAAPDPFLSSLIYSLPVVDSSKGLQSESFDEGSLGSKIADEKVEGRPSSAESLLSHKDQKERAQRSEFVQGLLLSTIFEDTL